MENNQEVQDDNIVQMHIDQMKTKKIPVSQVRTRQKTCTIADLKKDEVININQSCLNLNQKENKALNKNKSYQVFGNYMKMMNLCLKNTKDLKDFQDKLENTDKANEVVEVEFLKVVIVCQDRPNGNIELDFSKALSSDKQNIDLKDQVYCLKEGCIYKMRFIFKVRNDCVYGMKFINNIYKLNFIKVDKYEEYMGSFAPKEDEQHFDLPLEQAPDGFLTRGQYTGKALFIDEDGICHMQYEYKFKIGKDWNE